MSEVQARVYGMSIKTMEKIKRINSMASQGMSVPQIAEAECLSRARVYACLRTSLPDERLWPQLAQSRTEAIRQDAKRRYSVPGHREKMRAANRVHSDGAIAFARELWDAGLSINRIGNQMGVTRNVIVGIAHRNEFPPRPSPIRRRA